MNTMLFLVKRNLLCYFRDKGAVFFSLMAVLIVILLYLLFLRNMLVETILKEVEYASADKLSCLVDSWVLAGILGIVSVTASAGSLQAMVEDNISGKGRDFLVTPMKSSEVAGGYILSTFLVGLITGYVTFAIALVYLAATGCPMDAVPVVACAGLMVPSALSGSIIVFAIISRFRSIGAFSGFFAVVSVLIGFLTGIYMPMGSMNEAMQVIGFLVPATHMAALFRQNLCSGSLSDVFGPYDPSAFRHEMGFDLSIGGVEFTPLMSLAYVLAVTAVFFGIAVAMIRRR